MADEIHTSRTTTDHRAIKKWIEDRRGRPSWVRATANGGSGLLRVDFGEPDAELEEIGWNKFFEIFDKNNLAFLYQNQTADGDVSRFHKFVDRQNGAGGKPS